MLAPIASNRAIESGNRIFRLYPPTRTRSSAPRFERSTLFFSASGKVKYHLVPAVSLGYIVRRTPEHYVQRLRLLEYILRERGESFDPIHLPVEEPRLEERYRGEGFFDGPKMLLLRLTPRLEVRVLYLIRQETVHDDGVHPVVVEVQVRVGPAASATTIFSALATSRIEAFSLSVKMSSTPMTAS